MPVIDFLPWSKKYWVYSVFVVSVRVFPGIVNLVPPLLSVLRGTYDVALVQQRISLGHVRCVALQRLPLS
jgi:hypothetical protein